VTTFQPSGLAAALLGAAERQATMVRLGGYFGLPDLEHITDLAGNDWQLTRAQVIADMETGRRYFVNSNVFGARAYLEIMPAKSILGERYVRTVPDDTTANNLLSLPRF